MSGLVPNAGTQGARDLPVLVVIHGPPAAGKTTLAEALAEITGFPVLSCDAIKAAIWDRLKDPASYEHVVVDRAYRIFWRRGRRMLEAGRSIIIEQAFHRGATEPHLLPLLARSRAVYVYCSIPSDVAIARFAARVQSGERHASFVDDDHVEAMRSLTFRWSAYDPLDVPVPRLALDMTESVDVVALHARLDRLCRPEPDQA
jgi:predicted kinase